MFNAVFLRSEKGRKEKIWKETEFNRVSRSEKGRKEKIRKEEGRTCSVFLGVNGSAQFWNEEEGREVILFLFTSLLFFYNSNSRTFRTATSCSWFDFRSSRKRCTVTTIITMQFNKISMQQQTKEMKTL